MREYNVLTKFEIAEEQLFEAINLYLGGEKLVSSITLAGAAEEILGKLANMNDVENALECKVRSMCEMHELMFGEKPNPKVYYDLRNKARNELKHIGQEFEFSMDAEQEASDLILRAIKNYRLFKPGPCRLLYNFEQESLRRLRQSRRVEGQ